MARETLFAEQEISGFVYVEGFGNFVQISPAPFELTIDETYVIVLDGKEYTRTAYAYDAFAEGTIALGTDYPVTGIPDPDGLAIVIGYIAASNDVGIVALASVDSLTLGIYKEIAEPEKIIIKDPLGNDVEYPDKPMIRLNTTKGTALYSKGQILDGLTIQPDFSAGDMEITAPDGYLVKSAVIAKPENLLPENIREGENVAGVDGGLQAATKDVSTAAEMDALLTEANVGKVYRYTGETTETYISGDIYIVEVAE